jgi:hypothetical protein
VAALLLRDNAQKLRLLNALREPDVGLPLTMPQLQALSLPVVVNRWVMEISAVQYDCGERLYGVVARQGSAASACVSGAR